MNEITGENLSELEKIYRSTIFIVFGQIFVVLLLVLISCLITFRIETELSEQDFTTLWIAVLFIAVGSFILRRMFFNWERLKNIGVLKGIKGLLQTLRRNSIILSFFSLMIGIAGFLIAAIRGNTSDVFRAAAVALVVFLINFPRKKVWRTIISNLDKV